jgi:glutaredoxin-like YruB-family protein
MSLPVVSIVLLSFAVLVALVGTIIMLVAAFRQSVPWGLVVLFVPAGNLVFTCVHWAEARLGFLVSIASSVFLFGGIFTIPGASDMLIDAGKAKLGMQPPPSAPKAPTVADLSTQIAEQRKKVEELQGTFATVGQDLPAQYQQLEKRRTGLKAADQAAITKFNEDAAAYQAKNKKQKEVQQELTIAQTVLDQLLDARLRAAAPGGKAGGKQVVMYTTSHCPACKAAKQYMAQKGIRYQEIDVEASREANEAFQKLGARGVPLIMVGDKKMEGFNSQELDRMLL